MSPVALDRISLELTRRCSKGCAFCYNGSSTDGRGEWDVADVLALATDCARNGVRAISLGGGEPLEHDGVYAILGALEGVLLRTLTTNGLLLEDPRVLDALVAARPDKVHVSVHSPGSVREVDRVIAQVDVLARRGVRSGINLLVRASRVTEAAHAAQRIRDAGIGNERIVYLPMRGEDTPTASHVATVARGPFQSMSCLRGCAKSERFASIGADRTVAWCSYTVSRVRLATPRYASIVAALDGLALEDCAGGRLVKLGRSARSTPS